MTTPITNIYNYDFSMFPKVSKSPKIRDVVYIINYDTKELILNDACPVCLSDDVKCYKKFYKCSHHICGECFINWKKKDCLSNCPMCRASEET